VTAKPSRLHTPHGEVHGKSIESVVVHSPGGVHRSHLSFGLEHYTLSDALELIKAFRAAYVAASLDPVAAEAALNPKKDAARCLDESTQPCRSEGWTNTPMQWCAACRANGAPLPAVGR
jgi:hypothetical protein